MGRDRMPYAMGTHITDSDPSGSRRYLIELFDRVKGEAEQRGGANRLCRYSARGSGKLTQNCAPCPGPALAALMVPL
jgi:hypothetical protein